MGLLRVGPEERLIELVKLGTILNIYISTKNVLSHLVVRGTRYIIELAQRNDKGLVFRIPGASILKTSDSDRVTQVEGEDINTIGTGIYEILENRKLAEEGIESIVQKVVLQNGEASSPVTIQGLSAAIHGLDFVFNPSYVIEKPRVSGLITLIKSNAFELYRMSYPFSDDSP